MLLFTLMWLERAEDAFKKNKKKQFHDKESFNFP
jgi:hypothetical protein